jgi:hypothetical protein
MTYTCNNNSVITMNQAENSYLLNNAAERIFLGTYFAKAQLEHSCVREALYESAEDPDPVGHIDSASALCRAGPRWSWGLYDRADVRRGDEFRGVLVVG